MLYIAGPMAGIPDYNYPAFFEMERHIAYLGLDSINPARLDEHDLFSDEAVAVGEDVGPMRRAKFLKRDFFYLSQCDGIVMLPGWQNSTGANCELWVSRMMGLVVFVADESETGRLEVRPAPRLMPLFGPMAMHARDVMMAPGLPE